MRTIRRSVRGWAANVVAEQNKHKEQVVDEYNFLCPAVKLESYMELMVKLEINARCTGRITN